jgi:hypothetical protein
VRATSRTLHGTQHPTFHYDLRGQGRLVLTEPRARDGARGILRVSAPFDTLVLRDGPDGAVVAELVASAPARQLSLPPAAPRR